MPKKSKSDWTKVSKSSGASAIERHVHGCKLTVIPKSWKRISKDAAWSVDCHASGRHERGEAPTLKGAKVAAMHIARKLGRARAAGPVAKKTKARANTKTSKRPSRARAKSSAPIKRGRPGSPRVSPRQRAEDLRRRTAGILAGLPSLPSPSESSPPSNRDMEADIARVSAS